MATAVVPKVFKNFINGEWVESASGRAFENRNPAKSDELVGMFPASTAEDVDAAVDAAREAFEVVAAGAGAQARGDSVPRRGDAGQAQGRSGARHDAGDGQGPCRNARRRAGSHRHDLLHGRGRAAAVWADHAVGAARQVRHVGAAAAGRVRAWLRRGIFRWRFRRGRSCRRWFAGTPW